MKEFKIYVPLCFRFKGKKLINQKFFNVIMKKHNFNAGPSVLPREVIEKTAQAVLDFNGSGLSILEISHRSKDFQAVMDEAIALFKELLEIPSGYSVVFLGGGASLQFCMVPFNLLEKKAAYLLTGTWASKAYKEAKGFGEVVEVASSKDANFSYIPKIVIPTDVDYFHITTNNTIFGTEIFTISILRFGCRHVFRYFFRPADV